MSTSYLHMNVLTLYVNMHMHVYMKALFLGILDLLQSLKSLLNKHEDLDLDVHHTCQKLNI